MLLQRMLPNFTATFGRPSERLRSVLFTNTPICRWSRRVADISWLRKAASLKRVKPKLPQRLPFSRPAPKAHTTAGGEHKKAAGPAAAYLAPAPGRGWSHSTDAMKLNLPAFNRNLRNDSASQRGRWDAPLSVPGAIWFPGPPPFPQADGPQ